MLHFGAAQLVFTLQVARLIFADLVALGGGMTQHRVLTLRIVELGLLSGELSGEIEAVGDGSGGGGGGGKRGR